MLCIVSIKQKNMKYFLGNISRLRNLEKSIRGLCIFKLFSAACLFSLKHHSQLRLSETRLVRIVSCISKVIVSFFTNQSDDSRFKVCGVFQWQPVCLVSECLQPPKPVKPTAARTLTFKDRIYAVLHLHFKTQVLSKGTVPHTSRPLPLKQK